MARYLTATVLFVDVCILVLALPCKIDGFSEDRLQQLTENYVSPCPF